MRPREQDSHEVVVELEPTLTMSCFRIRASSEAQSEGLAGLTPLLNDSRGAVKKRAIRALGSLVACSNEATFTSLLDGNALPALSNAEDEEQLRTAITLTGTLAASSPRRTGKRVSEILPHVLKATSSEDVETKEVALQVCVSALLIRLEEMTDSVMHCRLSKLCF